MKALTFDIKAARWVLCKVLGALTPAVYWSSLSGLRLGEVPEPRLPGPGWVKLQTLLGGICGTDLGIVLHRTHPGTILRAFASFPAVMGHENVALIQEVGPQAGDWRPGSRVVVEPSLSCEPRGVDPPCPACAAGRFSLCENFGGTAGFPAGTMIGMNSLTCGSWAPAFVAHASQLHALPEAIPDEQAVLIDPIACSLHGVLRHRPAESDRIVVQGGGIIGLGVVMVLRGLGFANHVTGIARHPYQGNRLREYGADEVVLLGRGLSPGEKAARVAAALDAELVRGKFGNWVLRGGADVVYECVGTVRALTDAMRYCRSRGTVVALGTAQLGWIDTTSLWLRELTIIGAQGRELERQGQGRIHTYDLTIDLMRSGKLRLEGLLTHVFDLADYKRAFSTLVRRPGSGVVKAAFRHEKREGATRFRRTAPSTGCVT